MSGDPGTLVWLGSAPPLRSIRWLDGVLAIAAKFPRPVAVAAGDATWLDLASDRATRVGIESAGVATDLSLDYLGWAQIAAAVARQVRATTILVDEASRPDRIAEVAAIAELVEAAQITSAVALALDGTMAHASRLVDGKLQDLRVQAPVVIGVRVAGPSIDEYPTPMPSAAMRRLDLAGLGLDAGVLAHRALPAKATVASRRTVERVAELLALYRCDRAGRDPA